LSERKNNCPEAIVIPYHIRIVVKININTIEAKTRTERDISIRATRAKFRIRFKIKVIISVQAISVFSIDYITKAKRNVGIRAKIRKDSVFSTDRIAKVRGTKSSYNTKSRTEFKVRTGIVKAYIRSTVFGFVRIASYRAIVLKVRKGSRLKVC